MFEGIPRWVVLRVCCGSPACVLPSVVHNATGEAQKVVTQDGGGGGGGEDYQTM